MTFYCTFIIQTLFLPNNVQIISDEGLKRGKKLTLTIIFAVFQDIAEANFRTSSSRLLAAVMSALCNTSVKLTSILPIAYDGEVLLRSLVKQVSTENDSALAHRFPLLVAHMEKLSHVSWHCVNV